MRQTSDRRKEKVQFGTPGRALVSNLYSKRTLKYDWKGDPAQAIIPDRYTIRVWDHTDPTQRKVVERVVPFLTEEEAHEAGVFTKVELTEMLSLPLGRIETWIRSSDIPPVAVRFGRNRQVVHLFTPESIQRPAKPPRKKKD